MYIGDIDNLFRIAVGICMFFTGTAAVIKIYKGSKIPFAYTMTLLTCAYGVTFVLMSVLGLFYNGWRVYVDELFWFIYYWLSI